MAVSWIAVRLPSGSYRVMDRPAAPVAFEVSAAKWEQWETAQQRAGNAVIVYPEWSEGYQKVWEHHRIGMWADGDGHTDLITKDK